MLTLNDINNAIKRVGKLESATKEIGSIINVILEISKQTNDATEDIHIKIEAIRDSTDSTTSEIKNVNNTINNVSDFVNRQKNQQVGNVKKYIKLGINGLLQNSYKGYDGKLTEKEIQMIFSIKKFYKKNIKIN